MTIRRGPKGGYSFPEKEKYRFQVWSALSRTCPVPIQRARALLMPSTEGDEIEVAKRAGFKEKNLIVVDRNPAIVATLKRRFPQINDHDVVGGKAGEIEVVCERLGASGIRVHVANFDFTSCMGFTFGSSLNRVANSGVLDSRASWAMTLLRGRESFGLDTACATAKDIQDLLEPGLYEMMLRLINNRNVGSRPLIEGDALRVGFAMSIKKLGGRTWPVTIDRVGVYPSGKQTMIWAVIRPSVESKNRRGLRDAQMGLFLALHALAFGVFKNKRPEEVA